MNIKKLLNSGKKGERLLPLLEKSLKERPYFSLDDLRGSTNKLHRYLNRDDEDINTDELNKLFFGVWDCFFRDRPRSKGYIHPSQLKGACERKQVYELMGAEENEVSTAISPQLQRIFDQGTFFHLYIQTKLWLAGVLQQSEAPVHNRRKRIKGSTDGIVKLADEWILEIKTITTFKFATVKLAPLREHVEQAMVYAMETNRKRPIKGVIFLYINKDNCDIVEHHYLLDSRKAQHIQETITEQVTYLNDCANSETLPARVCKNEKEGERCPYVNVCFKIDGK